MNNVYACGLLEDINIEPEQDMQDPSKINIKIKVEEVEPRSMTVSQGMGRHMVGWGWVASRVRADRAACSLAKVLEGQQKSGSLDAMLSANALDKCANTCWRVVSSTATTRKTGWWLALHVRKAPLHLVKLMLLAVVAAMIPYAVHGWNSLLAAATLLPCCAIEHQASVSWLPGEGRRNSTDDSNQHVAFDLPLEHHHQLLRVQRATECDCI